MIPRYTLPEMGAIWSEATRFRLFVEVEVAVVRARVRRGLVPADDLAAIEDAPVPAPERVHLLDDELHHDVIAFLTAYGEVVGSAATPWVRPRHSVSRCSSARSRSAPTSRSSRRASRSQARVSCRARVVSSRSEEVMP